MREQLQSIKKDVEFIKRDRSLEEEQEDLDEIVQCQYHIQDVLTDIVDYLIKVV